MNNCFDSTFQMTYHKQLKIAIKGLFVLPRFYLWYLPSLTRWCARTALQFWACSFFLLQRIVTIRSFTKSPLNSLDQSGRMCHASHFAKSSTVRPISSFQFLFSANSILLDCIDCSICTEEASSKQEREGVERRSVTRVKRKIIRLTKCWLLWCLDPCT